MESAEAAIRQQLTAEYEANIEAAAREYVAHCYPDTPPEIILPIARAKIRRALFKVMPEPVKLLLMKSPGGIS